MSYATAAQLERRLGTPRYEALIDLDADGVEPDELTSVDEALESASGLADTYVSRWPASIRGASTALRNAVIDIATFELAGDGVTDAESRRHDNALQWLRDLSAGKAQLDDGTGDSPPAASRQRPRVMSNEPAWQRSASMGGPDYDSRGGY